MTKEMRDILLRVAGVPDGSGGGGGADLPAVTSADNGKVLSVVNGAWGKSTPAEGVTPAQLTAGLATKQNKITEVTISANGAVTRALESGKLYHFTGTLTALTVTLTAPTSGDLAHYHFDFSSGSTAPAVAIPSSVVMPDGLTFEPGKHYEVDILNNYGAVMVWTV